MIKVIEYVFFVSRFHRSRWGDAVNMVKSVDCNEANSGKRPDGHSSASTNAQM